MVKFVKEMITHHIQKESEHIMDCLRCRGLTKCEMNSVNSIIPFSFLGAWLLIKSIVELDVDRRGEKFPAMDSRLEKKL